MPLPRFHRLPEPKRRTILDAAAHRLASDGPSRASYNAILADAGISKASAYQYFDSRDDLVATVLRDVAERLLVVLGPWRRSHDPVDFAAQWRAGVERLMTALRSDPVLLALAPHCLEQLPEAGGPSRWLGEVIADGQRVGVVRADQPPELLLAVSGAVLQQVDRWAVSELAAGNEPDLDLAYSLLESLWRPS